MTCDEAREALLEADLAELDGTAATPLAAHVATCAECRHLAERIVLGTDALGREREHRPRRPAGDAAAAARRDADRIRRVRRRWLAATPALAAAAVAVILLARSWTPGPPSGPFASSPPATPVEPGLPLVAAAAPTVAVFETANPKIVVVWQFPD
jgi:hypothetical protein